MKQLLLLVFLGMTTILFSQQNCEFGDSATFTHGSGAMINELVGGSVEIEEEGALQRATFLVYSGSSSNINLVYALYSDENNRPSELIAISEITNKVIPISSSVPISLDFKEQVRIPSGKYWLFAVSNLDNSFRTINNSETNGLAVYYKTIDNLESVPENFGSPDRSFAQYNITASIELTDCIATNTLCPVGNYTLSTQSEVDSFTATNQCNEIQGNLTISGADIVNLDGLSSVISIGGSLLIDNNTLLTSLEGFPEITSLDGNLGITSNPMLKMCTQICPLLDTGAVAGMKNISNNAEDCSDQLALEFACSRLSAPTESLTELVVYPNPTNNGIIYINEPIKSVVISNNLGQVFTSSDVHINGNKLDLSKLDGNLYYLTITDIKGNVYKKEVLVRK